MIKLSFTKYVKLILFLMLSSFFSSLAKSGSFGFVKGRLVCRANSNVPCVRLAKIILKKMCGGENKKHRVGLSVGFPAVRLRYGLYVVLL